jgi:lysophospholipase L1-like esterase
MKQSILIIYFIAMHLLIGMILWKSDFIPRVKSRLTGQAHINELPRYFHDMRCYYSRSVDLVPEGSVFFIGDSIIQGLCVDAVIQPSVNYGIGGDTTVGVLERMGDYAYGRAGAVVLCIGGNDLKFRKPTAVLGNVKNIIDRIDPSLPIVVSSVPLEDESFRPPAGHNNGEILKLNALLEQLADNSSRLYYCDHSNLSESGQLLRHLHVGDGMHPNNEGNRILAANFRMAIRKALGKENINGNSLLESERD